MQERTDLDRVELLAPVAEPAAELDRDLGDALDVAARVEVLRLHRPRQRGDQVPVRFPHLVGQGLELRVLDAELGDARLRPRQVLTHREHHRRGRD